MYAQPCVQPRPNETEHGVVIPDAGAGKSPKTKKRKPNPAPKLGDVDPKYAEALQNANGDGVVLNVVHAAELFKAGAKAGDVRSLYELGLMLAHGVGVKRDVDKASKLLKKCAKQGIVEANAALAEILSPEEGYKYLKVAVDADDLNGHRLLVRELAVHGEIHWKFSDGFESVMYLLENEFRPLDGHYSRMIQRAITEKRSEALEFLAQVKEAAKTDKVAQYLIGVLALSEIVKEPHDVYLIKSFMQGYRPAFDMFCENQVPITKDIQKAKDNGPCAIICGNEKLKRGREKDGIALWKKAAETCVWAPDSQSLEKAIKAVKIGTVDKKDIVKLLQIYADNGSGYAQERLGELLVLGKYVDKDEVKGLYYLKMAFDNRNYRMLEPKFLKKHCKGFFCIE